MVVFMYLKVFLYLRIAIKTVTNRYPVNNALLVSLIMGQLNKIITE